MSASANHQPPTLSMLVELARDDNPRLYDDLVRFNKGTKRINRLRFLAHEGLLAQYGFVMTPSSEPSGVALPRPVPGKDPQHSTLGDPRVTNAMFDPPISD